MADAREKKIRWRLLYILRSYERREDVREQYMTEELIQAELRIWGYALMPKPLHAMMVDLKDRGYVKYRETAVGETIYYGWRILAKGNDVLEGTIRDPAVGG